MYIGPQGIVHGTYITLLNAGRLYLGVPEDGSSRGAHQRDRRRRGDERTTLGLVIEPRREGDENHQQADGSVRVPAALQPFLGGRTTLEPLG